MTIAGAAAMSLDSAAIMARLTAPGAPFALRIEQVGGQPVTVFDSSVQTLQDVVRAIGGHGEVEALVYQGERWTYARMVEDAHRVAAALQSRFGVRPGDFVAIAMRNMPEWAIVFWATQIAGAVTVAINAWSSAHELAHLVSASQPKVLFADPERLRLVATPRPSTLRAVVGVRCPDDDAGAVRYEDLQASDGTPRIAWRTPDDAATLIFTSGTTGSARGVLATHRNQLTTVHTMRLRGEVARLVNSGGRSSTDPALPAPLLLGFPLFHVAGLAALITAHFTGRLVALMYKWDLTEATALIEDERIGEVGGPPLIGRSVIDAALADPAPFASLTSIGFGGAQTPPRYITDVESAFSGRVAAKTGYGMTETTAAVTWIAGRDFLTHPGSVGRMLPTAEANVVDDQDQPLPPGRPGQLRIRGAQVVDGYLNEPADTARSFRDGWFYTGDIVAIDSDGFLTLVGRSKDVVIRGGENIYCPEIESVLAECEGVADVAVVGIPHDALGEQVCAVVCTRDGAVLTAAQLTDAAKVRLAAFKVPEHIVFSREALPRNAAGKLLKAVITEQVVRHLTDDVAAQWI